MLIVQQHGVFHIRLVAVGIQLHAERVLSKIGHLAAFALFTHHANASVKDIPSVHIFPTVLHMPLSDGRRVVPAVLVHVVVQPVLLAMQQQLGTQMFIQMQVRHRISFGLQSAVGIQIYVHALLLVRF